MRKKTITQIEAMQRHINRNFKRWFRKYSNIEGIEVALKEVNGEVIKDCYAIVFHVSKKTTRARKKFPKSLRIDTGRNKKITVQTDVIETGPLELQGIKMGDGVRWQPDPNAGTISFYMNAAHGVYVCSNMHVMAPNFLNRSQIIYDVRRGDPPQPIVFFDNAISSTAQLIHARYNGLDIAFARVDHPLEPQIMERSIGNLGPLRGFFDLNPSNAGTVALSFLGRTSGLQRCNVIGFRAVKGTVFKNVFLTNLLRMPLCTQGGDSGAPVFDQRQRLVGIVIGRDTRNSFALHINDVLAYFQTLNL
jgi:hypothetical protein